MNTNYFFSVQQLQFFISVAEHLSFTKAARQHHMSQTAMSQNILTLEKQLGFSLFDRSTRKVALTAAGKHFYTDTKGLLSELDLAISSALIIDQGYHDQLRIGFQGIHERTILPNILKRFQKICPQIAVSLVQETPVQLSRLLENEQLDLIFTLSTEALNTSSTEEYIFSEEPLCAVVAADHPLAHKDYVRRDMFSDDPFVFIRPESSAGTYSQMIEDCRKAGFSPNIVTLTENVESVFMLINAGIGISFFPKCCSNGDSNLRFLELQKDTTVNLCVRWNSDCKKTGIPLFLNILRQIYPSPHDHSIHD